MKLKLKEFQEEAVDNLVRQLRMATMESNTNMQTIILSSPTGSGKTIIATASIERIIQGDGEYAPDDDATFLWLSDQPEINEQTRRKMFETSSILDNSNLHIVDSTFDKEFFTSGKVFFLNTQKLGKEKQLVTHGDDRTFTIWETITNTININSEHFFVFIDEAHRGMSPNVKDVQEAATIIQKFIKGSANEIPLNPIIIGISATPERFDHLLQGTDRIRRPVSIPIDSVRNSGLLKDTIKLFYPVEGQQTDITMLKEAVKAWKDFTNHWIEYCIAQKERIVDPILVVQVQDGTQEQISRTDIGLAIETINNMVGPFSPQVFAHSFQENAEIDLGSHKVRYISPADISSDPDVKIVFFKTSLNTGWDCPRAEVMMSFRKALDSTLIAQLVGRMVRTPLARRISGDEFLNSVALYLPHYDEEGLRIVIDRLTNPDAEIMPSIDIVKGADIITLSKSKNSKIIFDELEKIPSYIIPKTRKMMGVRRLMKLARLLANDDIQPDAIDGAKKILLDVLYNEYSRLCNTLNFKTIIEAQGKIKIKSIDWQLTGELKTGNILELDIARENLNDLFETAGRKLGEGLHKEWWRSREAQDGNLRNKAKLEAVALSITPEVISKLEKSAHSVVREWLENHRQSINKLQEVRRQQYNEVRQLASEPEIVTNVYPEKIEVRKANDKMPKHLYVDENGEFPTQLNNWETTILQNEQNIICGWLRNFDRKSWSLTIPYEDGGETRALYPDFLVIRDTTKGLVIDLLDPHNLELADAPKKAAGLAKYAASHADIFGRIELIILEGNRIKRINLKDEVIRNKVKAVSTKEHLKQLYEN